MIHSLSLLPLVSLLSSFVSASFDCVFDIPPHHFNLSPLKGVHTTSHVIDTPPSVENTTAFIDLCQDLKWSKDIDADERCAEGAQGNSSISERVMLTYSSLCDKV